MPISPASGEIHAKGIAPMWIQVEERFLDLVRRRIERGIDEQRTDRNIALTNKFRAEVDRLLRPGQSEVERILVMAYGRGTAVAGGRAREDRHSVRGRLRHHRSGQDRSARRSCCTNRA